ncbi:MAG: right-handed parallel beta-helix repeat-containing protein [Kiritimatiellaeota bacterium]|nr:right-handed parallel beta-helix repeat-containing protein [Kiritimatiellota bacterium]
MQTQYWQRMLIGLGLALTLAAPWASATNYYVVTSSQQPSPTPPWTNWGWAHTNLIEVIAAARNDDTVYVTNNAVYKLTNQITVSYAITVRSWGPDGIMDPTNTILVGNYPTTTNRHFQLNNSGATLAGFTLTNGWGAPDTNTVSGGSIYLQSGIVTNCIIMRNYALCTNTLYMSYGGGGILMDGSGNGGVWNCTISSNVVGRNGGGIFIKSGGSWRIANCTISGNSTTAGAGGGIVAWSSSSAAPVISNCWVVSNYANSYGGGIYISYSTEFRHSLIMGNTVDLYEGGGVRMNGSSLLRNCLVVNNLAKSTHGGGIYINNEASIQNCTIASNSTGSSGSSGGLRFAGTGGNIGHPNIENTIIWGNSGGSGVSNLSIYATNSTESCVAFTNVCTSPIIVTNCASWVNTITSDPRFVSAATADFRLQSDSPCINAGVNRAWMEGALDYYGYRRIDNFRRTVDIGAYEYLGKGTLFRVH